MARTYKIHRKFIFNPNYSIPVSKILYYYFLSLRVSVFFMKTVVKFISHLITFQAHKTFVNSYLKSITPKSMIPVPRILI
jgi:hypothetical protein